ncbi:unnamed protein product [Brassica napus]|uniref:(rape) hypothetical protein n=1 Tax=Brassica napus TaxID=3708 RepID=A0A816UF21_BRANA|nr:unnamed protein product [Brassica napus]
MTSPSPPFLAANNIPVISDIMVLFFSNNLLVYIF